LLTNGRAARVIQLLSRLPGVGEKTAQRYLLYLLTSDERLTRDLGAELSALRDHMKTCVRCGNVAEVEGPSDEPVCEICADGRRDASVLCVVGRVQDLIAIERAGAMRGHYFVLGKLLSPLDGVGPEDLPIDRLLRKIDRDGVKEVILATPPSVDGEATALLLKRELERFSLSISRIASGIPHGGDLEFADPITMGRALAGRQKM
jgi:recombination protein RecR